MNDNPPSNAKIYPRPERQGPSPILLILSVLILVILGFFVYQRFAPAPPAALPNAVGSAGSSPISPH